MAFGSRRSWKQTSEEASGFDLPHPCQLTWLSGIAGAWNCRHAIAATHSASASVVFSSLAFDGPTSACTTCKKLSVFKGPSQGISSWYLRSCRGDKYGCLAVFPSLWCCYTVWQRSCDPDTMRLSGVYDAIVWPNVYASSLGVLCLLFFCKLLC